MARNSRSPAWPFLSILACLFALSITAPRAWQRIAHHTSPELARHPHDHDHDGHDHEHDGHDSDHDHAHSPKSDAAKSDLAEVTTEGASRDEGPSPTESVEREPLVASLLADNQPPVLYPTPTPAPTLAPVPEAAPVPVAPPFGNQVQEDPLLIASKSLPKKSELEEVLVPPPAPHATEQEAAASRERTWAMPAALLNQLATLSKLPACQLWVSDVRAHIQAIADAPSQDLAGRNAALAALAELIAVGPAVANRLEEPIQQTQFLRAHYALQRRLAVWRQVVAPVSGETEAESGPVATSAERVSAKLEELQKLMASSEAGAAWREYLLLERLGEIAQRDKHESAERRELAREILERMDRAGRSDQQRRFVETGPLAVLSAELHNWGDDAVTPQRLLASLENYERTGLTSDADALALACRQLGLSDVATDRQLAGEVDHYYRNANMRVAVAGILINRFVPQPEATNMAIADTIIGVPVRGRSTTWTQLSVKLIPDPKRVRLGLEATGIVASDTTSSSGPATFYNNGTSRFLCQKLFLLGPKGLREFPAISSARGGSNLVGLETGFDGIPLFGPLVRSMALSQFEDSQPQALSEADQKLSNRARTQFDSSVGQRVQEAEAKFKRDVWRRAEQLGVEATPVSYATTEERVVVRMRVAGDQQLGAHTPRPRAPSDSLMSVQLHQSAVNNGLERLDLAGRRFSIEELFSWINRKLDRPQLQMPDDLPDNLFITFATKDPVVVRFNGGRAELCLAIAELTQGRNHWRNFGVRAWYKPETEDLQAGLMRDSGIRLEGEAIKGKPEVLLRGIFSRVLSANRRITLVAEEFAKDARVKDLAITQFAIDDGWIGLAAGPKRAPATAQRGLDGAPVREIELSQNH